MRIILKRRFATINCMFTTLNSALQESDQVVWQRGIHANSTAVQCVTGKLCLCVLYVCEVTQPLRIFPRTIYSKHLDSKQQPTISTQLPSLSKLCLFSWFRSREMAKLRHITGNCWKPQSTMKRKDPSDTKWNSLRQKSPLSRRWHCTILRLNHQGWEACTMRQPL